MNPGNCKQSVPVALSIFHETTSYAIKYYFPERLDASEFLNLFYVWWIISNSKMRYDSRNPLGKAAVRDDMKPQFLRALADWIVEWENEKIPNGEKFCLTSQAGDALKRTLKCHA